MTEKRIRLSNGYDAEFHSEYKGMKIYKSSKHLYFVDRGDSHYHGCISIAGAHEFIDRFIDRKVKE